MGLCISVWGYATKVTIPEARVLHECLKGIVDMEFVEKTDFINILADQQFDVDDLAKKIEHLFHNYSESFKPYKSPQEERRAKLQKIVMIIQKPLLYRVLLQDMPGAIQKLQSYDSHNTKHLVTG